MRSQKEFCVALGSRTSLGLLVGGGSGLLKGGHHITFCSINKSFLLNSYKIIQLVVKWYLNAHRWHLG